MKKILFTSLLALIPAMIAMGQTANTPKIDTGDTAWMLTSTALVLLMTVPGLALFYGGMVRKKNILSTFYYSLGAAVVVSVLWVIGQYSLSFGTDINGIIGGMDKFFLSGVTKDSVTGTIPEFVFIMYQLTFAIITVSLISGAVVERMKFSSWMIFVVLWSLIVYAPIAHWVWGGGWLAQKGALDFAGGLVVHITSGVSGLIAAIVLGPRVRYKKDVIAPSNIPYTFIGAALLWVGWFGFNAGSATAANGLAGSAFLVTNTAAAMAGITWLLIEWIVNKKPSIIGAASGVVAGLVAITPAAGYVDVKAAIVIGIVVSILCYMMVAIIKKKLGYDDSLDAFGIHGVGGTWGAIATGLFANPLINTYAVGPDSGKPAAGLFFGNAGQLGTQLMSVLVAIGIAVVGTLIILFIIKVTIGIRVEPQEEIHGLDLTLHGERVE